MFNSKFILIITSCIVLVFLSCKKYETLPELDLGNNMNPEAGVEYVKLDSTRIYYAPNKILKSYVSIKSNLISDMGFTYIKINVYKNGYLTGYLTPTSVKTYLDNVVSGQVLKFEYTVVDSEGRESKKSMPFTVTIP